MVTRSTFSRGRPHPIASIVRQRIEDGGERLWRLEHFCDLPFMAVAQALSRLSREGIIERLSKGIYYRGRATAFGKSQPNSMLIQKLLATRMAVFPSGIAAANLLGFTTQNAARREIATIGSSVPRKLVGSNTVIHARRPEAWAGLSEIEAALLDFLRRGARMSDLSPAETGRMAIRLMAEKGRFPRLLKVAASEPPRVRAILGALGEEVGITRAVLRPLRASLNPFSRFDFGLLTGLPHARKWQAK
jgi:hypothetical protein